MYAPHELHHNGLPCQRNGTHQTLSFAHNIRNCLLHLVSTVVPTREIKQNSGCVGRTTHCYTCNGGRTVVFCSSNMDRIVRLLANCPVIVLVDRIPLLLGGLYYLTLYILINVANMCNCWVVNAYNVSVKCRAKNNGLVPSTNNVFFPYYFTYHVV